MRRQFIPCSIFRLTLGALLYFAVFHVLLSFSLWDARDDCVGIQLFAEARTFEKSVVFDIPYTTSSTLSASCYLISPAASYTPGSYTSPDLSYTLLLTQPKQPCVMQPYSNHYYVMTNEAFGMVSGGIIKVTAGQINYLVSDYKNYLNLFVPQPETNNTNSSTENVTVAPTETPEPLYNTTTTTTTTSSPSVASVLSSAATRKGARLNLSPDKANHPHRSTLRRPLHAPSSGWSDTDTISIEAPLHDKDRSSPLWNFSRLTKVRMRSPNSTQAAFLLGSSRVFHEYVQPSLVEIILPNISNNITYRDADDGGSATDAEAPGGYEPDADGEDKDQKPREEDGRDTSDNSQGKGEGVDQIENGEQEESGEEDPEEKEEEEQKQIPLYLDDGPFVSPNLSYQITPGYMRSEACVVLKLFSQETWAKLFQRASSSYDGGRNNNFFSFFSEESTPYFSLCAAPALYTVNLVGPTIESVNTVIEYTYQSARIIPVIVQCSGAPVSFDISVEMNNIDGLGSSVDYVFSAVFFCFVGAYICLFLFFLGTVAYAGSHATLGDHYAQRMQQKIDEEVQKQSIALNHLVQMRRKVWSRREEGGPRRRGAGDAVATSDAMTMSSVTPFGPQRDRSQQARAVADTSRQRRRLDEEKSAGYSDSSSPTWSDGRTAYPPLTAFASSDTKGGRSRKYALQKRRGKGRSSDGDDDERGEEEEEFQQSRDRDQRQWRGEDLTRGNASHGAQSFAEAAAAVPAATQHGSGQHSREAAQQRRELYRMRHGSQTSLSSDAEDFSQSGREEYAAASGTRGASSSPSMRAPSPVHRGPSSRRRFPAFPRLEDEQPEEEEMEDERIHRQLRRERSQEERRSPRTRQDDEEEEDDEEVHLDLGAGKHAAHSRSPSGSRVRRTLSPSSFSQRGRRETHTQENYTSASAAAAHGSQHEQDDPSYRNQAKETFCDVIIDAFTNFGKSVVLGGRVLIGREHLPHKVEQLMYPPLKWALFILIPIKCMWVIFCATNYSLLSRDLVPNVALTFISTVLSRASNIGVTGLEILVGMGWGLAVEKLPVLRVALVLLLAGLRLGVDSMNYSCLQENVFVLTPLPPHIGTRCVVVPMVSLLYSFCIHVFSVIQLLIIRRRVEKRAFTNFVPHSLQSALFRRTPFSPAHQSGARGKARDSSNDDESRSSDDGSPGVPSFTGGRPRPRLASDTSMSSLGSSSNGMITEEEEDKRRRAGDSSSDGCGRVDDRLSSSSVVERGGASRYLHPRASPPKTTSGSRNAGARLKEEDASSSHPQRSRQRTNSTPLSGAPNSFPRRNRHTGGKKESLPVTPRDSPALRGGGHSSSQYREEEIAEEEEEIYHSDNRLCPSSSPWRIPLRPPPLPRLPPFPLPPPRNSQEEVMLQDFAAKVNTKLFARATAAYRVCYSQHWLSMFCTYDAMIWPFLLVILWPVALVCCSLPMYDTGEYYMVVCFREIEELYTLMVIVYFLGQR